MPAAPSISITQSSPSIPPGTSLQAAHNPPLQPAPQARLGGTFWGRDSPLEPPPALWGQPPAPGPCTSLLPTPPPPRTCPQAPRPLQCSPPRSARRRRRPQGAIPAGTGLGSAPRGAGGREGKRKGKGRERGGRRAPRSAGSPGSAPRPGPRGGRGARSRGGFGNAERGGGGKGRGAERRRRAEREGVGKQEGSCEPVWG